jgi:1-pyrroline-5-carboxylate dehydrogenase
MFLHNSRPIPPRPANEPTLGYAPGSPERAALKQALVRMSAERIEIPMVIGGEKVRTGKTIEARSPHAHARVLAVAHEGGRAEVDRAIAAAREAWPAWSSTSWSARAAVFLRAAELVAGKYRQVLNAATMLGQSKTAHQAEIDAACELADFLRFNVWYASQLYAEQPDSAPGVWNALELRPLEGFVLAVTPFNFTAIACNLPAAPALMGNTVVWKPSPSAIYSNHYVQQVFEEAGLPPGVLNVVQGPPQEVVEHALASPELAGVHFTGSTHVFQSIWRHVGERIASYRTYPRVVGETGGKDFILAHPSADLDATITAIIRGGYEFQGQKCSAASRVYLPQSLWKRMERRLCEQIDAIKQGDVADFSNFMGAVINQGAYLRLEAAIGQTRNDPSLKLLAGGGCDPSTGWFVRPTLVRSEDPKHDLMQRELFGPLVCAYVYDDAEYEGVLNLVNDTSPYALTGAIMATDRRAIDLAHERLRHAAGNFYVNDKCTGAVVGQQPFGGARQSGTNDKAGSSLNLLRWVSPRTIKETFQPPTSYPYSFMLEP